MSNEDIIRSVIWILAIDGKIEQQEKQFLTDLCKRLNISNTIAIEIFEQVKKGQGRIYIPTLPDEQKTLFTLLIQAAWSDGSIAPKELKALEAIAIKVGISVNDVKNIIEAYRSPLNKSSKIYSQQESAGILAKQSQQNSNSDVPPVIPDNQANIKNESIEHKWYNNRIIIFILMIVFWPVGMYALWKSSVFSKSVKIFFTIPVLIFSMLLGNEMIPGWVYFISVAIVGMIALIISAINKPYKTIAPIKINKEIEVFLKKMSPDLWEEINSIRKEFTETQKKLKHLHDLKARFPQQAQLIDESIAKLMKIQTNLSNVLLSTEEKMKSAYVAYKIDEIKGRTKFAEVEDELSNSITNVLNYAQAIKSTLEDGVTD